MFLNKYISTYIAKKTKNIKISDVYSEDILVDFYNYSNENESIFNDINVYVKNINKNEKVVELAAGSGRILIPMTDRGYDILGVEKEEAMINSIERKYSSNIIKGNIFEVEKFKEIYSQADVFILGATTISLFSAEQIKVLLKEISKINKKYRIYFDFINLRDLITKFPTKELTEKGTYYYHNFIQDNKVIYNLYHMESETLGYSVKYMYDIKSVEKLLEENNIKCEICKQENNYYLIEGEYSD